MPYTAIQLSRLSGISVRALHHYDEVGLLKPARNAENGYRLYGEPELLRLQQILFFKELDFPLERIKEALDSPGFNVAEALLDHRRLLELRKKRLASLIRTVDKTLRKLTMNTQLNDGELYGSFSTEESDAYAKEAEERWGNTDAYRQSRERYAKMTKEDLVAIQAAGDSLMKEIAARRDQDPASPEVQALIAKHYDGLRAFYEPNLELYRGLASMYVDDARFSAFYEKYAPGLAIFMREAMHAYCDTNEGK